MKKSILLSIFLTINKCLESKFISKYEEYFNKNCNINSLDLIIFERLNHDCTEQFTYDNCQEDDGYSYKETCVKDFPI